MPWCQLLIEEPDGDDERSVMRLVRDLPAAGDLIEVDGANVLVTSVSRIPPRKRTGGRDLSVLIYCRPQ